MKTYKFVLLIFISFLFCNSRCEYEEGQRFTILNNSDKEIIILLNVITVEPKDTFCIKQFTRLEYGDLIHYYMIEPNSYKNLEKSRIGERVLKYPNDTLSISVFNRIDMDTMSCEEFKQKYPLKKEWKVTLADMEACNWTLVYP
jgi:hypothetical protein